jgi:predicted nucleotidyltransferase
MNESLPDNTPTMQAAALNVLRGNDANRWSNIAKAQAFSLEKSAELAELVGDLLPTDEGSLVLFGSLARGEYTADSDLDWTVLIDGRADSLHLEIVHSLRQRLAEAKFKVPGPTEVFGGLVFSHDLVHAIGGEEDTNKNTTRRLLLLLESTAIGPQSSGKCTGAS